MHYHKIGVPSPLHQHLLQVTNKSVFYKCIAPWLHIELRYQYPNVSFFSQPDETRIKITKKHKMASRTGQLRFHFTLSLSQPKSTYKPWSIEWDTTYSITSINKPAFAEQLGSRHFRSYTQQLIMEIQPLHWESGIWIITAIEWILEKTYILVAHVLATWGK